MQDQRPVQGAADKGVQLPPILLPLQAGRQVHTQTSCLVDAHLYSVDDTAALVD